jgi:hypothetical protein
MGIHSGSPSSIEPDNAGGVYVGGGFATVNGGTVPATNIARWDATGWHALGSGAGDPAAHFVQDMSLVPANAPGLAPGDLWIGGTFPTAGGKASAHIGRLSPVALGVTLAAFDALPRTSDVLVTWETADESDNLGFNLYRSTDVDSTGARLNGELIPSQIPGGGGGASYEWVDASP